MGNAAAAVAAVAVAASGDGVVAADVADVVVLLPAGGVLEDARADSIAVNSRQVDPVP